MSSKKYILPALFMAVALAGGGTAYAFGPGGMTLPAGVPSGFTATEQTAITQAQDIREKAEAEADKILSDAGVTREEMHTAMETFHKTQRDAIDAALDANDINAFKTAVAQSPMGDKASTITDDVFAKMVQIRNLEKSGNTAGAQALRKELGDAGFGFGPMGDHLGHGGMHHGGMMNDDADDN